MVHSVQVLHNLGPRLCHQMIKLSPQDLNYHIANLPEFVHATAVHAKFPEIQEQQSLRLDCALYSPKNCLAVLRVLCTQPYIHKLELLHSFTGERWSAKCPFAKAFYGMFRDILKKGVRELLIHSVNNPCYTAPLLPLDEALMLLTGTQTLRKLSFISTPGIGSVDISRTTEMAKMLARGLPKLTQLQSLTLISSCNIAYRSDAGLVAQSILHLPQLTALHFDVGQPTDMTDCVKHLLSQMIRTRWLRQCLQDLASESGMTVKKLKACPPPIRSFQRTVLQLNNYVHVNLMQGLSSMLDGTLKGSAQLPCASRLVELCINGYLDDREDEVYFGGSLVHFTRLEKLQLLYDGSPDLRFADFAEQALKRRMQQRSLQLVDPSSTPSRDWMMSTSRDCSVLAHICTQSKLQHLGVAFECGSLSCQDLEEIWKCLSVPSLTSLDLKLVECPCHTAQAILMPVPSLTRLKRLAVRANWNSFSNSTTYRSPLVDIYNCKQVEHLTLFSHVHAASSTGFMIFGLEFATGLTYLAMSGRYEHGHAQDLYTQISRCSRLQTLKMNELCWHGDAKSGQPLCIPAIEELEIMLIRTPKLEHVDLPSLFSLKDEESRLSQPSIPLTTQSSCTYQYPSSPAPQSKLKRSISDVDEACGRSEGSIVGQDG